MNVRQILLNSFILLFLVWFISAAILLLSYSKSDLHLLINSKHSSLADSFFYFFTDIGDGLFATIMVVIMLIFSRKKAIQLGTAILVSSMITQFFKKIVFTDSPRPFKYFNNGKGLHLIDGLKMHSDFSFPSGHATTAFSLFLCLSLMTNNRILQIVFFSFAILAAFSRVYLSQHFLGDVFVGSTIGVIFSLLIYLFLNNKINPKLDSPFGFLKKK